MFARKVPVIVLAGLAVLSVAGCGGSDGVEGTIPAANADQLKRDLDGVTGAVAINDCAAATASANQFRADVNALPDTAGADLKAALRSAADNLIAQTQDPSQCQQGATGATGVSGVEPTDSTSSSTTSTTSSTSTTETPPENPGHGGEPPGHGEQNPGNANGHGGGGTGGTGDSGGTGG